MCRKERRRKGKKKGGWEVGGNPILKFGVFGTKE